MQENKKEDSLSTTQPKPFETELRVKKLDPTAVLPAVAHAGEDLGFDLFALEDAVLPFGEVVKVRTGIAASAVRGPFKLGLLIRDRSSMAVKGITTSGGVIDAGYTGEIAVLMTNQNKDWAHALDYMGGFRRNFPMSEELPNYPVYGYFIKAGDKIAQMVPMMVLTGSVTEVESLEGGQRGDKGYGSTGR